METKKEGRQVKITIQNGERVVSVDDGQGHETSLQEAFELVGDALKGLGYSAEAVQEWFDIAPAKEDSNE